MVELLPSYHLLPFHGCKDFHIETCLEMTTLIVVSFSFTSCMYILKYWSTTHAYFVYLKFRCTMSIRQNIQKLLGFAPSRAANKQSGGLFGQQPPSLKWLRFKLMYNESTYLKLKNTYLFQVLAAIDLSYS